MKNLASRIPKKVLFVLLVFNASMYAQVGINNNTPKATLEISASNTANPASNDGLLIPKVDAFPSTNPGADQHSMIVYLTTTDGSDAPGFYYWDNDQTKWIAMGLKAAIDTNTDTNIEWINQLSDGKSDSDGSEDGSSIFLGINAGANDDSSDNKNIAIGYNSFSTATTAYNNVAIGHSSLISATTGYNNIALGTNSMNNATTAYNNIAFGENSLSTTTSGTNNISLGLNTLNAITTTGNNIAIGTNALVNYEKWSAVAIGHEALMENSTGGVNTAIGTKALKSVTTGGKNTAIGGLALELGVDIENTTAIGAYALRSLESGEGNTAIGAYALNTFEGVATGGTPNGNTAIGNLALSKMTNGASNTDGIGNTAIGFEALEWGVVQNYNTAIGHFAGFHSGRDGTTVTNNTFIGKSAGFATSGSNNTFIGSNAGGYGSGVSGIYATGSNNVFIGNQAGNNTTHADTDDQLVIANSNTSTPLIYGEFDTNKVTVNGTVEADKFKVSTIETSAPGNGDGEVGEIRVVKTGGKWYFYVKIDSSTWKRAEAKN